jgi:hypothetical protein
MRCVRCFVGLPMPRINWRSQRSIPAAPVANAAPSKLVFIVIHLALRNWAVNQHTFRLASAR